MSDKLPINTPLLITLHDGTQFVGTASDELEGQWVAPTVYDGHNWSVEKVKDWRPIDGWISVDERLPERPYNWRHTDFVPVLLETGLWYKACYSHMSGLWVREGGLVIKERVTHWQPLPPPPTENDQ